ncbi:hypothetical protein EDC55_10110 [Allofrancisella inopinata]|uniref:Uncharacterized protein n=1 Tax=Allofrancisella inopinata TaxID=1085647 RepID=A0AAE7CQV6_9GAMM|nr:hypothetical protein [Allofrancisella inopinata]QIV96197.1 hypothetical protein E4K63_04880 [Allofrancisella inopinata]TDT74466.1 hypothetical protein EDC55_10110 [Allofrancisella inopinata]
MSIGVEIEMHGMNLGIPFDPEMYKNIKSPLGYNYPWDNDRNKLQEYNKRLFSIICGKDRLDVTIDHGLNHNSPLLYSPSRKLFSGAVVELVSTPIMARKTEGITWQHELAEIAITVLTMMRMMTIIKITNRLDEIDKQVIPQEWLNLIPDKNNNKLHTKYIYAAHSILAQNSISYYINNIQTLFNDITKLENDYNLSIKKYGCFDDFLLNKLWRDLKENNLLKCIDKIKNGNIKLVLPNPQSKSLEYPNWIFHDVFISSKEQRSNIEDSIFYFQSNGTIPLYNIVNYRFYEELEKFYDSELLYLDTYNLQLIRNTILHANDICNEIIDYKLGQSIAIENIDKPSIKTKSVSRIKGFIFLYLYHINIMVHETIRGAYSIITGLDSESKATTIKNYFSLLLKTPIRYVYSFMLSDSDRELLRVVNSSNKIVNNCCAAIGIKPTTKVGGHTPEQLWKWSTINDIVDLKMKHNDINTLDKELAQRYNQDIALMNLCGKPIKPQAYINDNKLGLKKGNSSIIQNLKLVETKEIRENTRLTEIVFEARHLESPKSISDLRTTMTNMQKIWDSLQFNKNKEEKISHNDPLSKEDKYLICPDNFNEIRIKSFYSALVYDQLNEQVKDVASIKNTLDTNEFKKWLEKYKQEHSTMYKEKWVELDFEKLLINLKETLEHYKLWSDDDYHYLIMCLCFWNKDFAEENLANLIKEPQSSSVFLSCIKDVICKRLGLKNISEFLIGGPKLRLLRTDKDINDEIIEFLSKKVGQIKINKTFSFHVQRKSKYQLFLLLSSIRKALKPYDSNNVEMLKNYLDNFIHVINNIEQNLPDNVVEKITNNIKTLMVMQTDKNIIYSVINSMRNFRNLHSNKIASEKLKTFLNQLLNEHELYVSRQEQFRLLIWYIFQRVCDYINNNKHHSIFHLHHRHSDSGIKRAIHFRIMLEELKDSIDREWQIEGLEKRFIKEVIDLINKKSQYTKFSGSINVNDSSLLTYIMLGFVDFNRLHVNINQEMLSSDLKAFNRKFVETNLNVDSKNSREHIKAFWRDFVLQPQ